MKLNFSVGKPKAKISERDIEIIESSSAVAERKWDGARMVGVIEENEVTLLSRALSIVTHDFTEYTGKFPHIIAELKKLHLPSGTILDGEVVMLDPEDSEVEDFDAIKGLLNSLDERARLLQKEKGGAHWILFDVLRVGGQNILHRSYRDRRKWLESLVPPEAVRHIQLTEQLSFKTIAELEGKLPATNWEGFVIKLDESQYEVHNDPTRTKRMSGWWKLRLDKEIDLIATGFDFGQGKFADMIGSLRCGIMDAGKYLHVCNVAGLTDTQRVQLMDVKYPFVVSVKYTQQIPSKKGKKVKYVDNDRERIVDVAPFSLRFPAFLRRHIDKNVEECTLKSQV